MASGREFAEGSAMTTDLSSTSINLAREPSFRLGSAEVRPATREVVQGDRREVLEPRVMQVLVALARCTDTVVSRNDLIHACWSGRVVGEDSISRCVAAVRRLSQTFGGFDIETIPRVGYRLSEHTSAAGASLERHPWRRLVAGAAIAALALSAGLLLWRFGPWGPAAEPRIAMQRFTMLGEAPKLKLVADDLSEDIAESLNQTHLGITTPGGVRAGDILVGATLAQEGPDLRVRAYLLDAGGANTLWTRQFSGKPSEAPALRDQVVGSVTEAAQIAVDPFRQKGLRIDPETHALYIKGAWAMVQPNVLQGGETEAAFSAAAAKAPHFVAARAMLSLEHMAIGIREPNPALRAQKMARARAEALSAIHDDSRAAEGAFLALYRYDRARAPQDLVSLENDLLQGLAKVPDSSLLQVQNCQLLTEVGRGRAAVDRCQRALALRPMDTALGSPYGHALYVAGGLDLAKQQLDSALRYHPDSLNARTRRLEIALFNEPPEAARERLNDERLRPQDWETPHVRLAELFLKARETRSPTDVQRYIDVMQMMVAAGSAPPRYLVLGATMLGRTDVAYRILLTPGVMFERDGFLFEPSAEPLRRDPRFWQVADRWGLVAYWRARNIWPDFCSDPSLGYDCRVAAASISSRGRPAVSAASGAANRFTAPDAAR
jgi:DNA-binding winged helix-turn-helix (wHTH) protein/TolB-like protein